MFFFSLDRFGDLSIKLSHSCINWKNSQAKRKHTRNKSDRKEGSSMTTQKRVIFVVAILAAVVLAISVCCFYNQETKQVMEGTLVSAGTRI